MNISVFEATMLVCFGAAWPFAIWKSYRARENGSKSAAFLVVLFLGYVSGVTHKLVYDLDPVIALYALNGCMVFTDLMLYVRNRRLSAV